jgi:RNA-directed DNA polymerase
MAEQQARLTVDNIGDKLGLQPQFLFEAARTAASQYTVFDLPKRAGGYRTICSPKNELKRLQRAILEEILWDFKMPPYLHGCVRGRSIVSNATVHVSKPLVLTIDIRDFFGSIGVDRVFAIYKDCFHCDDSAAEILTSLTTYGNFLPQGAPTSPTLANIAALPLDRAIIKICGREVESFDYTRYVDDITISGDNRLGFLLKAIYTAIEAHHFVANPDKLRVGLPASRQKVTGVIVNKKLSAPKKLIRKIRQQLHFCERYGVEDHCAREGISSEEFYRQISGMLGYIGLMQPETAEAFKVQLSNIKNTISFDALDEEEQKFLLLKYAVEEEKTVTFSYHGTHRRVAPAELAIDDEMVKSLRGYQLFPESKWERFSIISIQSLEIEGFRS